MDCANDVNPAGPVHKYDVMPAVATNDVVAFEQIILVPVIEQVGRALTVIVPVAKGFVHGEPDVVTV